MPRLLPPWRCRGCAAALAVLCLATVASAQSADNVAVIINTNSPDSQRVGEYYARTRAIPDGHVIRIRTSSADIVERAEFTTTIEVPIAAAIRRAGLQDRLLYLVLTKGVPLRIAGTIGLDGTVASVDSELTLLYRQMTGKAVSVAGKVDNPYFLGDRALQLALPFSHREHDIYLVTRIDAFTVDQAVALVDRSQKAGTSGRIVLDQRDGDASSPANQWVAQAAKRLRDQGLEERIVVEATNKPARNAKQVLGYYFGGTSDPEAQQRTMGMDFVPGSIASTLVSSDARTLTMPPDTWIPAVSNDATPFAGTSDPLIGDLIREGVTGIAGQVGEPFVLGTVRPDILFPAYFSGFSLAEAFYLAIPTISWQTMVVGDPLMRPFGGRTLTNAELEEPIDAQTGLPGLFARRRLAQAAVADPDLPKPALMLRIRAETFLERGDRARSRGALEEAVTAAPSAVGLLLVLAQLEEADGLYPAAIAHYQRVIELQPTNVIALNNLAYGLAIRRNAPAEGLPLAKRAAALAPQSAEILDTYAWIEHLLGNNGSAAAILADAIRLAPRGAELWLHAAAVSAALGDRAKAERELNEALRWDSTIEQRDETRTVRERIASLPIKKG